MAGEGLIMDNRNGAYIMPWHAVPRDRLVRLASAGSKAAKQELARRNATRTRPR